MLVYQCRDCNGRPPYAVARNKNTRNEFRRFMALMPDKYDYSAAQVRRVANSLLFVFYAACFDCLAIAVCVRVKIPSPLTSEQEQERKAKEAKKKSEQKKAKREKQKVNLT